MIRPTRTIRRESTVTMRGRPLVLIIPPTADIILIREKGRRKSFAVDALTVYHVAAKLEAARIRNEKKEARTKKR